MAVTTTFIHPVYRDMMDATYFFRLEGNDGWDDVTFAGEVYGMREYGAMMRQVVVDAEGQRVADPALRAAVSRALLGRVTQDMRQAAGQPLTPLIDTSTVSYEIRNIAPEEAPPRYVYNVYANGKLFALAVTYDRLHYAMAQATNEGRK